MIRRAWIIALTALLPPRGRQVSGLSGQWHLLIAPSPVSPASARREKTSGISRAHSNGKNTLATRATAPRQKGSDIEAGRVHT
jgi:hypothetical protein